MPDFKKLKLGDRVRLTKVPEHDEIQRREELSRNPPGDLPGWTASTIERIIAQDPFVTISRIDEYGYPWFEYELTGEDGEVEYHYLNISDDDSWELV